MKEGLSKSSMLYWYPKISALGIPLPKTEIVKIPYNHLVSLLDGKKLPKKYVVKIYEASEKFGYPLFLRTDMGSAKHDWNSTCFVVEKIDLLRHIFSLIDTTLAMGMFGELDPNALVFREYLCLEDAFNAFDGMPVAKERRYFIKDGKVICHHPYWIEDAIAQDRQGSKPANWQGLLSDLNKEYDTEVRLLSYYSGQIAKVLDGYWSVDFAKVLGGTWYLIDMAEGDKSWHPKH